MASINRVEITVYALTRNSLVVAKSNGCVMFKAQDDIVAIASTVVYGRNIISIPVDTSIVWT